MRAGLLWKPIWLSYLQRDHTPSVESQPARRTSAGAASRLWAPHHQSHETNKTHVFIHCPVSHILCGGRRQTKGHLPDGCELGHDGNVIECEASASPMFRFLEAHSVCAVSSSPCPLPSSTAGKHPFLFQDPAQLSPPLCHLPSDILTHLTNIYLGTSD